MKIADEKEMNGERFLAHFVRTEKHLAAHGP